MTLIETIIALSIAVIVILATVPTLNRQTSHATNMVAQARLQQQLQHAQRVANAKMVNVAVCLSRDGKSCVARDGTIALTFEDSHADGEMHEESQLISRAYLKGGGFLHLRAYPYYRQYVLISPTIINASDNGTFWYCSADHDFQWAMTVNQYGEPHLLYAKWEC